MFPQHLMTAMSQKWDLLEKRMGHMLGSMNHRRLRVPRRRWTVILSSFHCAQGPVKANGPLLLVFFSSRTEEIAELT